MKRTLLRSVVCASLISAACATQAQFLFVNDNDNITYNTDTVLSALAGAGVAVTVYDIATEGGPPSLATMYDYPAVIWYCSSDGVDLGLWNAQQDLYDLASSGIPVWFIGTDMLYANFGAPPVTFNATDLPRIVMGVASYDAQSYGDDGGLGCPQLDATPVVTGGFSPELHWIFDTFWWMDGVTTNLDGAVAIYDMGPSDYALYGAHAMVHNTADGMNVMSSFFDPALIDTYPNRIAFMQQTLAFMDVSTGIRASAVRPEALRLLPDGDGGVFVESATPLRTVSVIGVNGQVERAIPVANTTRLHMASEGLTSGLHVVLTTDADGVRRVAKWVH